MLEMNLTITNLLLSKKAFHCKDASYLESFKSSIKKFGFTISTQDKMSSVDSKDFYFILSLSEVSNYANLSEFAGLIITFNENIKLQEIEKINLNPLNNSMAFLDLSHPLVLQTLSIKNMVYGLAGGEKDRDGYNQSDDTNYNKKLKKVLDINLNELKRLKKIHEKLAPLRQEKVKNLGLYSKFAAGTSSGGEFFDIKKSKQDLILLVSHTKSYVASSVVLNHFEYLDKVENYDKDKIEDFLENVINDCRELNLIDRDNFELIQIDLFKINFKTLKYEIYHFGNGAFYIDGTKVLNENNFHLNENYFEKAFSTGSLERGQKLVYVSPGVNYNLQKQDTFEIDKMIANQYVNEPQEVLNEIFYQLKKYNYNSFHDDEFLKYDSSVIYIEVDKNAFIQI